MPALTRSVQTQEAASYRRDGIVLGGTDAHPLKCPGKTLPTRLDLLGIEYESGSPVSAYPKAFPVVS